jgi:hypothetical protein
MPRISRALFEFGGPGRNRTTDTRIFNPFDMICNVSLKTEKKSILLIGNSHADSIKRVFSDKAAEYGISTFFVVANDPLMDGGPNAEQLIDSAVMANVKTLILHFSNFYGNEKFRIEVDKLIDIAKSKRIEVFIIAPVPTYDMHIPKAMLNESDNKESLTLTLEKHLVKNKIFRDFVSRFEHLGVEIYDPSDFLCNSEFGCLVSTPDSRPYYFDSHHLTLTGASVLKPLFERLLSRI